MRGNDVHSKSEMFSYPREIMEATVKGRNQMLFHGNINNIIPYDLHSERKSNRNAQAIEFMTMTTPKRKKSKEQNKKSQDIRANAILGNQKKRERSTNKRWHERIPKSMIT